MKIHSNGAHLDGYTVVLNDSNTEMQDVIKVDAVNIAGVSFNHHAAINASNSEIWKPKDQDYNWMIGEISNYIILSNPVFHTFDIDVKLCRYRVEDKRGNGDNESLIVYRNISYSELVEFISSVRKAQ